MEDGARWDALKRASLGFGVCAAILLGLFAGPLLSVGRLALTNDFHSHALLIPFLCLYLAWVDKGPMAAAPIGPSPRLASLFVGLGLLPLLTLWTARHFGQWQPAPVDVLFFWTTAFVTLIIGAAVFFFGRKLIGTVAFPAAMLFFLAPLPHWVESGMERFFQHASSEAALVLFHLSNTPVVREGLVLTLPTITLEVAPECSGIRSSLVLFITSLVAGHLFLYTTWKRALLTLAVIPLAIARNGLRIFVIGWLCVRIDASMIHSWVHRQGGPLFFVLSLGPFFALLLVLRRSERVPASGSIDSRTHEC